MESLYTHTHTHTHIIQLGRGQKGLRLAEGSMEQAYSLGTQCNHVAYGSLASIPRIWMDIVHGLRHNRPCTPVGE